MTFPTVGVFKTLEAANEYMCFNAREGLVTFPTGEHGRGVRESSEPGRFNAREGLVTFPTVLLGQLDEAERASSPIKFQCPRGLGDFSHRTAPSKYGRGKGKVSMPARAW